MAYKNIQNLQTHSHTLQRNIVINAFDKWLKHYHGRDWATSS